MGTHPIFESDFDCLTEMLSVAGIRQSHRRVLSNGSILAPVYVQKRLASYSKIPLMKDGSFAALRENQKIFKQAGYGQKELKAPESWKVEPKVAPAADPFALPDYKYAYKSSPFIDPRGGLVGQSVDLERIMPRCKGKLHP